MRQPLQEQRRLSSRRSTKSRGRGPELGSLKQPGFPADDVIYGDLTMSPDFSPSSLEKDFALCNPLPLANLTHCSSVPPFIRRRGPLWTCMSPQTAATMAVYSYTANGPSLPSSRIQLLTHHLAQHQRPAFWGVLLAWVRIPGNRGAKPQLTDRGVVNSQVDPDIFCG